jgi:hypothetical protein
MERSSSVHSHHSSQGGSVFPNYKLALGRIGIDYLNIAGVGMAVGEGE